MRLFQPIAAGIDVVPLLLSLYRQPGLWNQHTARTANDGPFYNTDDIWLRFRDPKDLVSREAYCEDFGRCVNYPAWRSLPHVRPIVFGLMARCEALELGGIFITRVPPGQQVKPHDDRGRWHAEYFETKAYVPLQTNPACVSTCGDERLVMGVGECWTFPNTLTHSTINDGEADRITLIICMRCT